MLYCYIGAQAKLPTMVRTRKLVRLNVGI